jgi:hypothetical protein
MVDPESNRLNQRAVIGMCVKVEVRWHAAV